jgi:hypothetical protein
MQGDGRRLVVLFAAAPRPNVPGADPQHPRQCRPRIDPCRTRALDRLVWPDRGFSPPYKISYRDVKLSRVSAALGRFELRREADLPQEGSLREDFRRAARLLGVRAHYRCSLGTNTVLGLVTNGLFAVPPDEGPEN